MQNTINSPTGFLPAWHNSSSDIVPAQHLKGIRSIPSFHMTKPVTMRDDGDDLFETATAIVNIVTTVTDRHASGGSYLKMICRPA